MTSLHSSNKMRTQTSRENGISSLYVLKALLAISVVALHSPHTLPWIGLPGLMVELFFVITGYFLFDPDLQKVQTRIWKSIKKVVPIILILQGLYALLVPPELGNPLTTYWTWFRLIFIGLTSFYSGHLWYLTALLFGLMLWLVPEVVQGALDPSSLLSGPTLGTNGWFSPSTLWTGTVYLCLLIHKGYTLLSCRLLYPCE